MGVISNPKTLGLVIDLVTKDTAEEAGDTIICLFGAERDWTLKTTNEVEGDRRKNN